MKNSDFEKYSLICGKKTDTLGGIGLKRAEAFSRLGINSIGELIRYFPRAYQNRGNIRLLSEAIGGESCSLLLTAGTAPRTVTLKNRKQLTKFSAFDDSGIVTITYFNSRYIESCFEVGETYRFWGRVTKKDGRLEMTSPIYEKHTQGIPLPEFTAVYPCGAGLSQKIIAEAIAAAAETLSGCKIPEIIPESFSSDLGLVSAGTAYRLIHRPESFEDIKTAREYFSAEELYTFALGISVTKNKKRGGSPPLMKQTDMKPFLSALGFTLTSAQTRSVDEIALDMTSSPLPMSRLLSGDVGSGKTAVAAAAIYIAVMNGYQAVMMAPTEILAAQHYDDLSALFSRFGFSTALLTGSLKASEKKSIKDVAQRGETDIIIGTHALITSDAAFARAGLVITDEQHRFGVSQRASLGKENDADYVPHVLVMSATPIPRTLALILYGDLDLSVLDEMPPGRQRVETFAVDEGYRLRLNGFIRKQVTDGGQVYIVCPAVDPLDCDMEGDLISFDETGRAEMSFDKPKLKSAVEFSKYLATEVFADLSIGLIHGKMKGSDKDNIMRRFASGEINVLVSTTVIEVGVNVPNASLMIVENAERFGLSQLHQLRGRVGRGKRKSYCILVSESKGEHAKKRIDIMRTTYNGYKIAEYDLQMRGPGDYFPSASGSVKQHGNFGSVMSADMNLLKKAMSAAENTLSSDPLLQNPENEPSASRVRVLFAADERAMQ